MQNVANVSVQEFTQKLGLKILCDSGREIRLETDNVSRPGLVLAGISALFANERVQVFGQTEYSFLQTLDEATRADRMEKLCASNVPCVIYTRELPVEDYVKESAHRNGVPLFVSPQDTTSFTSKLNYYLAELLAPTEQIHAELMDISGVGVLIRGSSGIGKSETALELVKRGHRLVADDVVNVKRINETLLGTAPEEIRYYMELRGIGLVDIRSLYGASALRQEAEIELVVDLEPWQNGKEYERIGDVPHYEKILGKKVPHIVLPITPGRNAAILLEAAAGVQRLQNLGYNAGAELLRRRTLPKE